MLIDTHAHLNFPVFTEDLDKFIERSLNENVWMINIGTNFRTSKRAVEIANRYRKGVYASIGLHPINLDTGLVKIKVDEQEGRHFEKEFDYEKYKALACLPKRRVVAIGEIGLDYYWKPKTKRKLALFKEQQKELFLKELELARKLNLPLILHCRMAHRDLIETLMAKQTLELEGVMHGFVGTVEQLQKYLDFGFYIGFNGIIFKKIEAIDFEENIKITPLERILIETDCPYLSPPKFEKERNEPIAVEYVAERIAQIKNVSFEKVAEITTKNVKELFKI